MELTEKVLVLKVGRFREADLWVRFFSPSRGVLTGFAFGGSKSKRRFCGCLDPLNQILIHAKTNRNGTYLNLCEGTLIHSPSRLRQDQARLGLAVNCLKFLEAAAPGREGASSALRTVLDVLAALEQGEEVSPLLPLFFRIRLAFDQGYKPDLKRCISCGLGLDAARPPFFFLVEKGGLSCQACGRPREFSAPLGPGAIEVLEGVQTAPPSEWGRMRLSPQTRRECFTAMDHFVRFHLGLARDKGGFRPV